MITTLVGRMGEIPVGLKPRMRELSEGPLLEWGFWGWTHHDGSTWACLGFVGATVKPEACVGWAGLTQQVDKIPVAGVYTSTEHRGVGHAEFLLSGLLRHLLVRGVLVGRDKVAAATGRWPKYPEIMKAHGLRCVTWGAE